MINNNVHILRYGTVAENSYLKEAINCYDYLAINGNSAAYISSAISKFIVNNFFNNSNKGYFIDPITYAFQSNLDYIRDKEKKELKRSFQKLVEFYKEPINKVVSSETVKPNDFDNLETCKQFCQRVIDFQKNLVSNYIGDNNFMEYISYATKNVDKLLKPKLLIAPYFYLSANDVNIDKWLECNIKLYKISSEISKNYNIPLFCQILISKNILLDDNLIDKIGLIYKDLNCDGFTLWVGGLDEHQATQEELKGYLKLLTYLKAKPVYSIYSGYFSTLLLNRKISLLNGVSHGLEYGESREVYPVGGGIPTSKYYYLPIHKRIDFTNAFYMLGHIGAIDFGADDFGKSQKYYKEVCDCQQCHKLLNESMKNFIYYESTDFYEVITKRGKIRRKKPSKYTKKICLFHFLLCKNKEFEDSNGIEINDLIDKMRQQHKKYNGCKNINNNEIDHLLKWIKVLEDYLK